MKIATHSLNFMCMACQAATTINTMANTKHVLEMRSPLLKKATPLIITTKSLGTGNFLGKNVIGKRVKKQEQPNGKKYRHCLTAFTAIIE